jgi:ADP-heptose:LPS heptosyltransferase
MSPGAGFYSKTRKAHRVLVIDPGMLGDTLHLLPAMRELRRNYPEAELDVLCSPVGAELHRLAGFANRMWVLPQGREERRVTEQLRVLMELRRRRFDASLNFGTNDRNLLYAAIIGARRRLGRKFDRWHFWSSWCVPDWVTVSGQGKPAFEERRLMLAAAGFPLEEARFSLSVPAEEQAWAAANIPAGALHFSLNASTPVKEWPLGNWEELARLLRDEIDRPIIATSSSQPRERQRLDAFAAAVPGARIFPGLPIGRLAAAIERCSLHVGADSGVLHLAVAVGTPTISLFRDYPGWQTWAPQGEAHKVFTVHCDCASNKVRACLDRNEAVCLAGISAAVVLSAVQEKLRAAMRDA